MANDKDQATNNKNDQERTDGDDDDFLTLSLCTPIRPAPQNPTPTQQPDPYLTSMYGILQNHTSQSPLSSLTSFYPYFQPQNPNPSPNFTLDFTPLSSLQNPNPNSDFLTGFGAINPLKNPNPNSNPNLLAGSGTTVIPRPQNPNPKKSAPSYGSIQSARPLAVRKRRNAANRELRSGKSQTVPALFPWATKRRATVHSLEHLESIGVETVTGEVQCKRCEKRFEVGYNLKAEFSKLRDFIVEKKEGLKDRSAPEWDNPPCLDCKHCQQKESAKAVVAEKKREINWLFLLLGGFLCSCTLEQLKYFCKHTGNHRTGAKNRVLYLTYLGLCKQLDPSGPFEPLAR